jgi:hypothetical protein
MTLPVFGSLGYLFSEQVSEYLTYEIGKPCVPHPHEAFNRAC